MGDLICSVANYIGVGNYLGCAENGKTADEVEGPKKSVELNRLEVYLTDSKYPKKNVCNKALRWRAVGLQHISTSGDGYEKVRISASVPIRYSGWEVLPIVCLQVKEPMCFEQYPAKVSLDGAIEGGIKFNKWESVWPKYVLKLEFSSPARADKEICEFAIRQF